MAKPKPPKATRSYFPLWLFGLPFIVLAIIASIIWSNNKTNKQIEARQIAGFTFNATHETWVAYDNSNLRNVFVQGAERIRKTYDCRNFKPLSLQIVDSIPAKDKDDIIEGQYNWNTSQLILSMYLQAPPELKGQALFNYANAQMELTTGHELLHYCTATWPAPAGLQVAVNSDENSYLPAQVLWGFTSQSVPNDAGIYYHNGNTLVEGATSFANGDGGYQAAQDYIYTLMSDKGVHDVAFARQMIGNWLTNEGGVVEFCKFILDKCDSKDLFIFISFPDSTQWRELDKPQQQLHFLYGAIAQERSQQK